MRTIVFSGAQICIIFLFDETSDSSAAGVRFSEL